MPRLQFKLVQATQEQNILSKKAVRADSTLERKNLSSTYLETFIELALHQFQLGDWLVVGVGCEGKKTPTKTLFRREEALEPQRKVTLHTRSVGNTGSFYQSVHSPYNLPKTIYPKSQ